jgi:hypothetical protein
VADKNTSQGYIGKIGTSLSENPFILILGNAGSADLPPPPKKKKEDFL